MIHPFRWHCHHSLLLLCLAAVQVDVFPLLLQWLAYRTNRTRSRKSKTSLRESKHKRITSYWEERGYLEVYRLQRLPFKFQTLPLENTFKFQTLPLEWAAVAAMSSQDRTRKNSGNQAYNELNTVIQVAPFPVKCVEVWQVVNLGK